MIFTCSCGWKTTDDHTDDVWGDIARMAHEHCENTNGHHIRQDQVTVQAKATNKEQQ